MTRRPTPGERARVSERAQAWLDAIHDDVRHTLNPSGDECWHCGGEGETYDCIDGCCVDAEFGCPDCARPCPECRTFNAQFAKAVRLEVVKANNVDLAIAWIKSVGRWRDDITREQVQQQLDAAKAEHPAPARDNDTRTE